MLYTFQLMYCLVSLISYTLTFLSAFDFCHSSSMFVRAFSYFTQELLPVILIEENILRYISKILRYFLSENIS